MRLELWDPGVLDEPDLNRQSLYIPADLGARKAEAARRRLLEINNDVEVAIRMEPITAASLVGEAFGGIDACFDCLDSFAARAGLEKAVIAAGERQGRSAVPIFHGGVSGFYGQAATISPPETGYERLFGPGFETAPADPKPVFPPAVAIVASLQVSEFIAWLKSDGTPRGLELLTVDCVRNGVDRIRIA
jgi:molybdopterin/thiamine biosynthesis adenylyltransferase